jgi:hypothetical protein
MTGLVSLLASGLKIICLSASQVFRFFFFSFFRSLDKPLEARWFVSEYNVARFVGEATVVLSLIFCCRFSGRAFRSGALAKRQKAKDKPALPFTCPSSSAHTIV